MLLNKNQINLINQNKTCFVKDFVTLTNIYDFNFISDLLEENELKVVSKTSIGYFKDVFQIHRVLNTKEEFAIFFDFLSKLFKYERDEKDGADLFFSLVSQTGNTHNDIEDVFIIGLKGKTIYRIFDQSKQDYLLEKGDMIFIPRGKKHKVLSLNSRIVLSIGFYGKRFKK